MILKKKFQRNDAGETLFAGYEFLTVGANPDQNFPCKAVDQYLAQGVVVVGEHHLTMNFTNGKRDFKINSTPGIYCAHCGEGFPLDGPEVPKDQRGAVARAHVEAKHKGEESPDTQNPSGYCVQPYYGTTLEA